MDENKNDDVKVAETVASDTKQDEEQEVTDTDADTQDVVDIVEADADRDDSELSEIRRTLQSLVETVNAMQSVILENGARIIDTDVDVDGNEGSQDGFYNLDALDLNLD